MGATLGRWLIGQSVTMTFVGTLTAFGLWWLGVAAPLALGLIAGMFAFVPYVGPILASAPGILIAAVQGPMPALYAAALYAGVHFVEGNLVTPLVQAEAVELPPVLTLFATLVFGLLLGPVGVLLAAPLTVVLLVVINALYLEDVLGEAARVAIGPGWQQQTLSGLSASHRADAMRLHRSQSEQARRVCTRPCRRNDQE